MNILVVGSGGREHALVWKISKSPYIERIYCAPGNAGISQIAECVDIKPTDFKSLAHFAKKHRIELTVVGPELPLALGIVDYFQKESLLIFGPTKEAAQIESSKSFAKSLMQKNGIPTAQYQIFSSIDQATTYVQKKEPPYVLKADGLAEGKGVLVCHTRQEALDGIHRILKEKVFGEAGKKLIIEEKLIGEEASVLAITDGEKLTILPCAQDHKPIFEGDTGPNTGGMGAYAPAPIGTPENLARVKENILLPLLRGLKSYGIEYRGVIYAGLMITLDGPKVLEFNCRFGDPETQAILPLLKTDLVDLLMESANGRLHSEQVDIREEFAVCVVMASGGYPGPYEKGKTIHGLNQVPPDILVFHAGTRWKDEQIVTSGGRVLGVTGLGKTIPEAIEKVYKAVSKITFDGAYYRRDIGQKALVRIKS